MSDENFSSREIELMFKRIDEKLDGIYDQSKKHNSRLSGAEEEINRIKTQEIQRLKDEHTKFKAYWTAGTAVITFVVAWAVYVLEKLYVI